MEDSRLLEREREAQKIYPERRTAAVERRRCFIYSVFLKLQNTTHIMMDSIVIEEPSSSTSYSGGGRAIDRHNPIIQDEKRHGQGRIFPSSSSISITSNTTPHNQRQNLESEAKSGDQKRKNIALTYEGEDSISPASSSRCLLSDKATLNVSSEFHHVPPPPPASPPLEPLKIPNSNSCKKKDNYVFSSSPTTPQPPPSPPPFEALSFLNVDDDSPSSSPPKPPLSPLLAPHESVKRHNGKASNKKHHDPPSSAAPKPPSPSPSPPSSDKVVVLEVSLHCRGCERKMKKHISKIEGVTSYKIEFAAKKVTVVGDVTPLAVLTSVLKVKNAKLLTPATISSSSYETGSVPIEP
ncbi:hypothetical protein L2E82_28424 [Cichorium intybus]|uniref:Uncharacterized protein n=1 Tax=Cichorium intybus TaxID=13427 RepID=A0ACB9CVS0_CICIN|nr:hypothetical protein L2E82_28424 [Cichorium intybus]